MKARCKYCKKVLGGDTNNGTTHLRNHTTRCIQRQLHDGTQKNIKTNFLPKGVLGDQYPTSNLFFPKICDLKLKLMEWKCDSDATISAMATKMWTKFSKYWSEIHLLLVVAVVIDPRYKLELVEYYAVKFGDSESTLDPEYIKSVMYTLVREYQLKHASVVGDSSGSSSVSVPATETDIDFENYLSRKKRSKPSSVNSELDHYLDEDVVPRSRDIEFDILGWWRANAAKYPTLHEIARDILVVPITFVASESAFSAGGRLLDPHRSRLHFKTVEALMCTRSWIKDGICRGNLYSLAFNISLLLCYVFMLTVCRGNC
ncbi:Putative AC9 transposase [Linum grandiflorum]